MLVGLLKDNLVRRSVRKPVDGRDSFPSTACGSCQPAYSRNHKKLLSALWSIVVYGISAFFGIKRVGHWLGSIPYIPISSTGHLILVGHWLEFKGETAASFDIFIQFGAIAAVLFYYRPRFETLVEMFFSPSREKFQNQFNLIHIALCIAPAVVMGFLCYDFIKENLFSPSTVAVGLIAGGILMIFSGKNYNLDTKEKPPA